MEDPIENKQSQPLIALDNYEKLNISA